MVNKLLESETECPECKGKLDWKVIYGGLGNPTYSGLCKKCNIVLKDRETPDLKKGRKIAENLRIKHTLDKRLTGFNADVQLGYFRTIQHCGTCGLPDYAGKYCKCKKCKCIYCREYK